MAIEAARAETIPANGTLTIQDEAVIFHVLTASAPFQVSFDGGATFKFADQGVTRKPNIFRRRRSSQQSGNNELTQGFVEIILKNTTGTDIDIEFITTFDDFRDGRIQQSVSGAVTVTGSVTANTGEVAATIASGKTTCATGAATQVIAANTSRKRVSLSNPSSAAGNVWIGDDSLLGAGEGSELKTGDTMEFRGTYALFVRNDTGSSIDIAFNEES